MELDGPSDEGVFSDLTVNPLQIIIQSEKPEYEFLPYPLEKNPSAFLPDLKETIPRMDEVMVAKADIPKELTGVQGVVEVEIPYS